MKIKFLSTKKRDTPFPLPIQFFRRSNTNDTKVAKQCLHYMKIFEEENNRKNDVVTRANILLGFEGVVFGIFAGVAKIIYDISISISRDLLIQLFRFLSSAPFAW